MSADDMVDVRFPGWFGGDPDTIVKLRAAAPPSEPPLLRESVKAGPGTREQIDAGAAKARAMKEPPSVCKCGDGPAQSWCPVHGTPTAPPPSVYTAEELAAADAEGMRRHAAVRFADAAPPSEPPTSASQIFSPEQRDLLLRLRAANTSTGAFYPEDMAALCREAADKLAQSIVRVYEQDRWIQAALARDAAPPEEAERYCPFCGGKGNDHHITCGLRSSADERLSHRQTMTAASALLARAESAESELRRAREALRGITERYVSLANSGDCGFWNPEEETEVIAARAALLEGEGVTYAAISDVRRKTKKYRFGAMARALTEMGIPWTPAADGEPLVRQDDLDGRPRPARNDGIRLHLIHK